MKIDNTTLVQAIEKCFDLSMDGRVPPADRTEFLTLGKRLRGSLLNLLSAEFAAGTAQVSAANQEIQTVNQSLTTVTNQLANTAQVIADLGE